MNNKVLLDSSALLALFHNEKGAEKVWSIIGEGGVAISAINYSEVVGKFSELGKDPQAVKDACDNMNIAIIPVDREIAHIAGLLRQSTKMLGLSIGDRICLSTAQVHSLKVITCDREWLHVRTAAEIDCIR